MLLDLISLTNKQQCIDLLTERYLSGDVDVSSIKKQYPGQFDFKDEDEGELPSLIRCFEFIYDQFHDQTHDNLVCDEQEESFRFA